MNRMVVRVASLALCASALGGCSMLSGNSEGGAPAPSQSARATDVSPMAPDIDSSVRQAQLLRASGDTTGATRIMSQLMLVYPDDPRVVGEYGKLLVQEGNTADAIDFLRRTIQLNPNDWTAYSALGVAFDQQHNPNNAQLAYEHALTMKPEEGAILNNYAMSRMLAGDKVGARTLLARAQASGSTDPRIASNLALLNTMGGSAAGPAPMAPGAPDAAPHTAVARADLPTPMPSSAPRPLVKSNNGNVVMQDVPVDPLAGPVAARPVKTAKATKPAKLAKAAHPAVHVAANTAAKPAKPADKPAHGIPALRMTADASKP